MTENLPAYLPASTEDVRVRRYVEMEHAKPFSGDPLLFEILYNTTSLIPPIEVAQLIVEVNQRKQRGELISLRKILQEKIYTPPKTLFDIPVHPVLKERFLELEEQVSSGQTTLVNFNFIRQETVSIGAEVAALAPLDNAFIAGLLSKFTLHVTALNNFLNCPLKFFFESLLRVPCFKSEAASFGSAVHAALEQFFLKMQQDPAQQFSCSDDLVSLFSAYMHRHSDHFTMESFASRMTYGEEILRNYYQENIPAANKIVAIERNISNVVVNGVSLKGKIDKLAFTGRDVEIIDYKTGDVERAYQKMNPPNDAYPLGGDYWRQAVFYRILVDNLPNKSWHVTRVEFDFIERDKNGLYQRIKIPMGPADIETVTQQILSVSQKIHLQDFYTGCGKEGCKWCGMARFQNKLSS